MAYSRRKTLRIYGDFVFHKLFKPAFGTIHMKETWFICYSNWCCLNVSHNGTLAKIQARKLFRETFPNVPLFQHLWDKFQFQLMRAMADCLSSGRLQEVKNNENYLLMRGDGLEERFQLLWFDLEAFGILKKWRLTRDGCLWGGCKGRFNCIMIWQ